MPEFFFHVNWPDSRSRARRLIDAPSAGVDELGCHRGVASFDDKAARRAGFRVLSAAGGDGALTLQK
jgi:hypothetical protein